MYIRERIHAIRSFFCYYRSVKFGLFTLAIFAASFGLAQSTTTAGWFDYNHTQFLTPDLSIVGDIGFRTDLSNAEWNLTYIRPGVNYRINSTFVVQGNVAMFLTFNDVIPNSTEFRLAQEARATWPRFSEFRFQHRVRAEQRFFTFENLPGFEESPSSDQSYRLRYFLSGTTDYFNVGPVGNLFVTGSAEYFIPMGDESESVFADESRFYAGFGQLLTKGWSYVLHFMWINSRNDSGDFEANEFVIRLRIYWRSPI
jgi:hypothetical protein